MLEKFAQFPAKSKDDAVKALALVLKMTAGAGLAGFGLSAAKQLQYHLEQPDLTKEINPKLSDTLLEYPKSLMPKKKPRPGLLSFRAAEKSAGIGRYFDAAAEMLYDTFGSSGKGTGTATGAPSSTLGDKLFALNSMVKDYPLTIPAMAVTTPMAATAGWSLAKNMGEGFRDKAKKEELRRAQEEYEEALMSQYRNKKFKKLSSIKPLQKQADVGGYLKDLFDSGLGWYAAYSALTGVPAAMYAYNKHKKSQRDKIEEVLRQRAAARSAESPLDVHILPEPISGDKN